MTYESELKQEQEEILKKREACKVQNKELEQEKRLLAEELEAVRAEHEEKLTQIHQEIQVEEERLKKLQDNAAHYEHLGEESLRLVREKLSLAREEAAGFLADLALFGSSGERTAATSSLPVAGTTPSFLVQPGTPVEHVDVVQNTAESLELLRDNLKAAGAEHVKELAYFLYGAFQSGTPLLLVGPQGMAVADALSCAMTGRHTAVLDCCGDWNPVALETVMQVDTAVIAVKHPFLHRWIDQLISEIKCTGKLWIFIHPYADDLSLEPVGLYSYVFPLVLDVFMTGKTSGPMVGCRRSSGYREAEKCEDVKDMMKVVKNQIQKPMSKSICRELAAWACTSMPQENRDFFRFACLLFPLAVALDRKKEFLEKLRAENNLSSTDRRLLEDAVGDGI